MKTTFDEIIVDVLESEGGFVDHPYDRGGPTNFGITHKTLSRWLAQNLSHPTHLGTRRSSRISDLSRQTAKRIYRKLFW